ncbi:UV DNA damage repair endonuclease UvsE, partial [Chloroflexota bacterium]
GICGSKEIISMKVGYPCINWTIGCKGNRTFRLKSYSEQRLIDTLNNNLNCLAKMLRFNVDHNLLFFRITSDLVPFASHPVCQFDWRRYFKDQLSSIGAFIRGNNIRISMHPGQYTLLNSHDGGILARSIKELQYHADVLDSLDLDTSAKIQIHIGGVYGDKNNSVKRFIERYYNLDEVLKRRLVIKNDDRSYTIDDCITIYRETVVPILSDAFHHELNHSRPSIIDALAYISRTWQYQDGIPMIDYSYRQNSKLKVNHAESIDISHFKRFIVETQPYDFDIMLEIKDKEMSALKAVEIARKDKRFFDR